MTVWLVMHFSMSQFNLVCLCTMTTLMEYLYTIDNKPLMELFFMINALQLPADAILYRQMSHFLIS